MSSHKIKIYTEALHDIQEATDWYNFKSHGLGTRYQSLVKRQINTLKNNPFLYAVRYTDVHCMLIKNFLLLFILQLIKNILLSKCLQFTTQAAIPKFG